MICSLLLALETKRNGIPNFCNTWAMALEAPPVPRIKAPFSSPFQQDLSEVSKP